MPDEAFLRPLRALLLGAVLLAIGPLAVADSTEVSLNPPEGFQAAAEGWGYDSADGTAVIRLQHIPEPLAKAGQAFGVPALEAEGATLQSFEQVELDGRQATLICVLQRLAGVTSERWVLVFGDTRETVVVNAVYPRKQAAALREPVRAALLSTRRAAAAD